MSRPGQGNCPNHPKSRSFRGNLFCLLPPRLRSASTLSETLCDSPCYRREFGTSGEAILLFRSPFGNHYEPLGFTKVGYIYFNLRPTVWPSRWDPTTMAASRSCHWDGSWDERVDLGAGDWGEEDVHPWEERPTNGVFFSASQASFRANNAGEESMNACKLCNFLLSFYIVHFASTLGP